MVLILKRKTEKTSKGYRLNISTHKLIDKMQLILKADQNTVITKACKKLYKELKNIHDKGEPKMLNEVKSRFSSGKKIIFLFLIVNCTLVIDNCFSQWQPDVRLTNDPGASNTSYNNAWCIAASGNDLHVVWYDHRDGNDEIYYKRSADGGISWGADTRLTNNSAQSYNPSVSVSGQVVHVVWSDLRDGNREIYYKRSTDGGISWGTDIRLTNDPATSIYPSVSVSGQVVHVVWYDNRDGNYEIYYKRSTDGGLNWGTDTRLTNDPALSIYPSISVSGQVMHVAWHDFRDGNSEIYYKRSTDGGTSWGTDTRLTNNSLISLWPTVTVSGLFVHVVWHDNRDGNYEIYYKRSTDGGTSWGTDTRLTNAPGNSEFASVSASGSVVHVVWQDNRDGNYEIYYKRDPTGNPVGIINIGSEIPEQFSLSQNYPNPFNPITKIKFGITGTVTQISNLCTVVIYNILGNEVATLVNDNLKLGTYEIEWDASNYPSGIYYYKLTAGEFNETRKAVLLK